MRVSSEIVVTQRRLLARIFHDFKTCVLLLKFFGDPSNFMLYPTFRKHSSSSIKFFLL